MADIIRVDFAGAATIKSRRVLRGAVLQPAVEDTSYEVVNEHASEPIKDVAAIRGYIRLVCRTWPVQRQHAVHRRN